MVILGRDCAISAALNESFALGHSDLAGGCAAT